jgi:exopolysaccharide biosynthesis WecB/TagA/CpsF family protein
MADTRDIMGVAVTSAGLDEAVALIDARLDAGERIKLAYLNAHGSNLAARDTPYRETLSRFTVLNDGSGLGIAARVLHGRPFAANLNGTDFTPHFLKTTRHRFRIYLLGAQPGVAEEAAAVLARIAPQHALAGARDGYFPAGEAGAVSAGIAASGADLVIVAMGNPGQELFIDRNFDAMGCRMAIGVGALLDFLAGRVPRAPTAFRRLGLEWVYRLGLEPGRMWRRYVLGNPRFLARVVAARLKRPR